MGISDKRLGAVKMLIEQAPDRVVHGLEKAFESARQTGPMAEVQSMVSAEMIDRRVRDGVFGPITPLCRAVDDQPPILPANSPRLMWDALKADVPGSVAEARVAALAMRRDDGPPPIYDELCKRAAEGLKSGEPPYDRAAAQLQPGAVERLVAGLGLASLARITLPRLPGWVRSMDGEAAAGVRLAFKDATAVDDNCAPTLMEMLFGQLKEPWQILRVISAVMDRPSDRYLAGSEMASFGERLLKDLNERVDGVRRFDPDGGPNAAIALAASIQIATIVIAEFEQWIDLAKDGPWGSQLVKARKELAGGVETILRQSPASVTGALPAYAARSSGKTSRMMPRTTSDLDPNAVRRGYAVLTFISESRSSAAHGGFASLRAKVIEDLDKQIDLYAEDLIDSLHEGGGHTERLQAYIEVAADFLGLVRDPKASEIIRRRAAVA